MNSPDGNSTWGRWAFRDPSVARRGPEQPSPRGRCSAIGHFGRPAGPPGATRIARSGNLGVGDTAFRRGFFGCRAAGRSAG